MEKQPIFKLNYLITVTLLVAGAAIFWATKKCFFFDEDIFVTNDKGVFIKEIWERSTAVKLTFLIDNWLNDTNPSGYHLTNLFFHVADSLLALLILKRFLKIIGNSISVLQSNIIQLSFLLFFLLSPIHSEPLCYILARGGSVAAFFLLLSILFFLLSNLKNKTLFLFSLVSFLLALFSYEISWTLPFIILSITIFLSYIKNENLKKNIKYALPYFIVFAAWFIIKVVVIDKFVVTDYKDDEFLKISFITLAKNNAILFLRNFIPPFKSTATFLSIAVPFIAMIAFGCIKLFKENKQLFYFLLLLLALTVLGFVAACLIGIDSHDSESERYIYFSSAFALMFLSVLLAGILKNKTILITVVIVIGVYYAYTLFKTIGYYKKASDFSQSYLKEINKRVGDNEAILFINQPSQYEGALLFRAKSRIDNNTKDKVSILQEYFRYLYNKQENCFTFSSKELLSVPTQLIIVEKPMDSLATFFPEINGSQQDDKGIFKEKEGYAFSGNSPFTCVALKDSTLFFFK